MKVVYVAGPYRAGTAYQVEQNINAARAVALEWWRRGWVAICPHANTAHFDGELPDQVWLDGDKELVRRCDALALVEGWDRSTGALGELGVALKLGIPVYKPGQYPAK